MLQPNSRLIANIYNPLNQDKETLLKNFVVRQKEFDNIFQDLKNSKLNQISQNFLIQGQRGTGKTTLLAKIRYEIEDSKQLSHLLCIQFKEEQYNIFSLNRLWENVADILEETKGFEKIAREMEESDDQEDFYFLLRKYLKKNRKKLVLLIDNFGDILDKLREKDHKKLRDILHESDLQIIAGSTRTLEISYKHDKPFFESFKIIYLKPLTKQDVEILLKNLNKQYNDKKAFEIIKNQKPRIETIRRLTGGVPRTIILLYEIILDDSATVFEDLEGILDKITPLYKHKMDDLPTQQQVIVDVIALNWDGIMPREISEETKIETKKISAQLKILEKNGFIISKKINKKNKLYMIEERFFNIWYLMRYGLKKKKQPVIWLVSFLKEWCTQDELIKKAQNHISLAKKGGLNQRGGYFMAEALSQAVDEPELQYKILISTKEHILKTDPKLANSMSNADEIFFETAKKAFEDKDFRKSEKYLLMAVENQDVYAMFGLGLLYKNEFKDFKKAEKYYLMAIENKYVDAMFNLSVIYHVELKDFEKAEKYYLMATENKHVGAMYNLSLIYIEHNKKYKEAVKYFSLFLYSIDNISNEQNYITNFFILLISRKQYHLALNLFQKEKYQLKEIIKPVYYALMYLMKDEEYHREYKRMGSEIKETVDEILEIIKDIEK